jgi:hypothetical protein
MKPIFTFPPPRRLAEQFFLLKTEKPVQTNGATADITLYTKDTSIVSALINVGKSLNRRVIRRFENRYASSM